jgi:hypothetical protein
MFGGDTMDFDVSWEPILETNARLILVSILSVFVHAPSIHSMAVSRSIAGDAFVGVFYSTASSAKHNSVPKPYPNIPDTLVYLQSTSMYFQMLPATPSRFAKSSHTLQDPVYALLKAPAVMEVHSGC